MVWRSRIERETRSDGVRFVLRSRRDIPTGSSGKDRAKVKSAKNDLRHQFHRQLKNLWDWTPFLKAQLDAGLAFGEKGTHRIRIDGGIQFYGAEVAGIKFIPLVTHGCPWVCDGLDVRFLIRQDRLDVLSPSVGDIDGRLTVLFDALQVPNKDQLVAGEIDEIPNPCFCLLEDDSVVRHVTAETLQLLNEPGDIVGHVASDDEEHQDHVVHVLVSVKRREKEFSLFGA